MPSMMEVLDRNDDEVRVRRRWEELAASGRYWMATSVFPERALPGEATVDGVTDHARRYKAEIMEYVDDAERRERVPSFFEKPSPVLRPMRSRIWAVGVGRSEHDARRACLTELRFL